MTPRLRSQAGASQDEANTTYILVTGANAGLGLATCTRLIDEFISTRPESQVLHLIITTRSTNKSSETITILRQHIARDATLKASSDRISISSHEVDLTQLRSVIALANTLNTTYPYINSIILNAGLMGTEGLYWIGTIWESITDPVQSLTWPQYVKHSLRTLAKPQLPVEQEGSKYSAQPEPPLGQIFTANVFGHYILVAHVMPLLAGVPQIAGPGRIIWVGSTEAVSSTFKLDDIQCLDRREAYASSKRLTDLLALSFDLPKTQKIVKKYLGTTKTHHRPEMYVCHPGVAATEIVPLPFLVAFAKKLGFHLVRLLGSPWHTISTYKAAVSSTWLALAPVSTIHGMEERDGKGKWGSATNVWGNERVRRTEVEGWGYGGVVGAERQYGSKGRKRGAVDLTEAAREEFEKLGVQVWEEMEALRREWEERLR